MAKVVLTPEAREDLREIKAYISMSLSNPGAANRLVKGITSQLRSLERFPEMGALVPLEESPISYRYLICGNYMPFYHVQKNTVIVDRILYGRRDYLSILFGDALCEETE